MKRINTIVHKKLLVTILFCLFALLIPTASSKAYTIANNEHVYDDAGVLNKEEILQLTQKIKEVDDKHNIDVFILTTSDSGGQSSERYISSFETEGHKTLGLFKDDSIILVLNLGRNDFYISTYGLCQRKISDSRVDTILDTISPLLSAENYYDGFSTFINQTSDFMSKDLFYHQVWFQLLVACGISGIIVGIMAINRGAGITTNSSTYLDKANSRLRFQHDNYIRTTVTRVRKPKESSSKGSGGGGRSHGGGGRSL